MKTYHCRLAVFLALASFIPQGVAQISVSGVSNRSIYTDQATFQIAPQTGFTYVATLNGAAVAVGSSVVVERMDHYELVVTATPTAGGTPVSEMIQFIVRDADRGSPETGLIKWVPYPPIPSAQGEFAGATLDLIAPAAFPAGMHLPVIARITDPQGHARRVNGTVTFPNSDLASFRLVRGAGYGQATTTNRGTFNLRAAIGSLIQERPVSMITPAWTSVSGTLPAVTSWTDDSRISVTGNLTIPAGGLLEVEAGTIIRLLPGVNILNSGRIVLRGTRQAPIVLTATNRVAPEVHTHAWGGFIMRTPGAEVTAEYTIFTGSGAATSFDFNPGASHRSEQALFLVHGGAQLSLTNCFAVNHAGQIGNGYNSTVTFDHCLIQRAITTGEYEGGAVTVNHSSLQEFPSIDDVYDAEIADSDYDGIYFTEGTHVLLNSFIGFAKDDSIDAGSGGPGTVVVSNCWVESTLHEALAWSGEGRRTWTYDTILLNNGQGIECGWSTGQDSPLCRAERLLSLGNSVGARYGDNYTGTSGLGLKTGFLWITNSLILHNYRDVWGRVWDDTWNYRVGRMDIRSNYLTTVNTNHPDNEVWNPAEHASALEPYLRVSVANGVGVGLAVWSSTQPRTQITNGVPVRLSSYTTQAVSVDYAVSGAAGLIRSGTLTFAPGEMVKWIPGLPAPAASIEAVRVTLSNATGGELTGLHEAWYFNLPGPPQAPSTRLIARGSTWKYLDTGVDAGTAWRQPAFDDTAWPSGPSELGFGDNDETTVVRGTNAAGQRILTTYFRHAFTVANKAAYNTVGIQLWRDDAGVVYLNGAEVYRSPNLPAPPAPILFNTLATSTGEDTLDTATVSANALVDGLNVAAVEIHQQSSTSSDMSFDFELTAAGAQPAPRLQFTSFGEDLMLFWGGNNYFLESAEVITGPWETIANTAPIVVPASEGGTRFYRLRN
jgi:hypothetical protein